MDVIMLFIIAGAICVTLGGIGLYFTTKARIDALEDYMKVYDHKLTRYDRRIKVIEDRDAQESDRVYIYRDEKPGTDFQIGGF